MSRFAVAALVIVAATLSSSCEAEECVTMRACCAAIADREWVGSACGAIVANLQNPRSCAGVHDAIRVTASERDETLPAVCQ